jgi:probable Rubsico expression protein CbbX
MMPVPPSLGPGIRPRAVGGWPEGPVGSTTDFDDLPDDLRVDATEEMRDARIPEVLERLDRELVALREVKARIREIAALLVVDRLRRSIGLQSEPPTLHMCFTGNPGTGKTTVATRMGEILFKLGYIRKGHLVTVTRDDLVGQYVGHTAPKTNEVIKRAMGGVLFIDEAYHVYRVGNERDYGQEVVEMLLQVMENRRQDLVVIMAGYKKEMDRFFSDVPGLSSRIAHHIDFPDYTIGELMEIARRLAERERYRMSPVAEKALEDYLTRRMSQPRFANGRSVRNALDRVRMRQAIRLYEEACLGRQLTKRDLVSLKAEDILKSRVFEGGIYAG